MRDRLPPVSEIGIKSQAMSITLNGRTYCVCSQTQMDWILLNRREAIIAGMTDDELGQMGEKLEDHIKADLEKFREGLPYATLNWLYERMSPEEKEAFKAQYRFGGVPRKWG